uniref:Uncharacterized protein n=1 Tax=Arundo donax TaxID=35708 RepID=A0A0A9B4E4_ARUDO
MEKKQDLITRRTRMF